MSLVLRQAAEYRDAYHEQAQIIEELTKAREIVDTLESRNRKAEQRLNLARRQLLEEAQR